MKTQIILTHCTLKIENYFHKAKKFVWLYHKRQKEEP